jgi:hypothetical protein
MSKDAIVIARSKGNGSTALVFWEWRVPEAEVDTDALATEASTDKEAIEHCGTLDEQRQPTQATDEREISGLSRLSKLDYRRRRKDAAKKLGVTVAALDGLVKEQRAQAKEKERTWRRT